MNGIENNYKSLRLRIYPNKSQEILINKTFGCCRFVYNYYLNEKVNFYKNFVEGIGDKSKRIKILNTFKPKTEKELKKEYSFLTEDIRKWTCPKCGINHIRDVNAAINLKNYIINIPKELRESMPVEGIEELAELALQISEYPLKQESQKLVINA